MQNKMGSGTQVKGLSLDKSRDSWSFIKEERVYMSRDEAGWLIQHEKHKFLLWQLLFINETRIWSEEQGDAGDSREREVIIVLENRRMSRLGECAGITSFFLLVRIQFPAMSISFLAVPNLFVLKYNITLAFIGLGCGYFLATSSNAVKRIFTVLCFAHLVKCLSRKILWSSFTPYLYLKV